MKEQSALSPRLALWILLIVVLIASLLSSWKELEPDAVNTAYDVAAKSILERANEYKQMWLVENKPDVMVFDQNTYQFSSQGWVLPLKEETVDCDYWLQSFYPDRKIFGTEPLLNKLIHVDDGYICRYNYLDNHTIVIKLLSNQFSVSVDVAS